MLFVHLPVYAVLYIYLYVRHPFLPGDVGCINIFLNHNVQSAFCLHLQNSDVLPKLPSFVLRAVHIHSTCHLLYSALYFYSTNSASFVADALTFIAPLLFMLIVPLSPFPLSIVIFAILKFIIGSTAAFIICSIVSSLT